ncbi:hypothetical protein KCU66_g50, partial [Aureobasidium melanogenum]
MLQPALPLSTTLTQDPLITCACQSGGPAKSTSLSEQSDTPSAYWIMCSTRHVPRNSFLNLTQSSKALDKNLFSNVMADSRCGSPTTFTLSPRNSACNIIQSWIFIIMSPSCNEESLSLQFLMRRRTWIILSVLFKDPFSLVDEMCKRLVVIFESKPACPTSIGWVWLGCIDQNCNRFPKHSLLAVHLDNVQNISCRQMNSKTRNLSSRCPFHYSVEMNGCQYVPCRINIDLVTRVPTVKCAWSTMSHHECGLCCFLERRKAKVEENHLYHLFLVY